MPEELPDADEVFARFFDRWYDDEDRERKVFSHTRPDLIGCKTGLSGSDLSPFDDEGAEDLLDRVRGMVESAKSDWPGYLEVSGELSIEWVDAFDCYYDEERVLALVRESDSTDFSNELLVIICQFGAVLGTVLRDQVPRLEWVAEWPYWESSL